MLGRPFHSVGAGTARYQPNSSCPGCAPRDGVAQRRFSSATASIVTFCRPGYARVSSLLRTKDEPGQMSRHFLWVRSRGRKLLEIEDRIFTRCRLRFYGSGLAIAYAGAALLAWALGRGEWVILPSGKLGEIDFCWIWMSGVFAVPSDSARIYDPSVLSAAQNTVFGPGKCVFYYFDYPPTSLLLT